MRQATRSEFELHYIRSELRNAVGDLQSGPPTTTAELSPLLELFFWRATCARVKNPERQRSVARVAVRSSPYALIRCLRRVTQVPALPYADMQVNSCRHSARKGHQRDACSTKFKECIT